MTILSSTEKEMDSPCVPSRRVVSKVWIFIRRSHWEECPHEWGHGSLKGYATRLRYGDANFFFLFEERHHVAEALADGFDLVGLGGLAHGEEFVAAGFVLGDPLFGEFAGLDFGEDLRHFGAGLIVYDARAAGVVAVFGGVADAVAHVAEAAFLDEVHDEFEFVEALEVSDLGGVSGFDQSLEPGPDEFGRAAAEDGLFAEEIAFGLFAERGVDDASLEAAERERVGQGAFQGLAGRVLVDGDEGGHAHAFGVEFADAVAGGFGRDHGDIDIGGGSDLAEVDVEAVGEHECLARGHVGGDLAVVEIGLDVIRDEDHDHIRGFRGLGGGEDLEAGGFGLGDALAAGGEADDDLDAGIAEVEGVGVALAAVADDGDRAAGEVVEISVFFVVTIWHKGSGVYLCRGMGWPCPTVETGGWRRSFLASKAMARAPE